MYNIYIYMLNSNSASRVVLAKCGGEMQNVGNLYEKCVCLVWHYRHFVFPLYRRDNQGASVRERHFFPPRST